MGQPERAREYMQLDPGSEWANWVTVSILIEEGKAKEARDVLKKVPATPRYHRDLAEAVLGVRAQPELDRIAQEDTTSLAVGDDQENSYYQGSLLAYAGKKDAAVHMLRPGDRAELLLVFGLGARSFARQAARSSGVRGVAESGPILPTAGAGRGAGAVKYLSRTSSSRLEFKSHRATRSRIYATIAD